MANPTVVGTPTAVSSGGNYTPGAGSNRLVVMIAIAKGASAAPTLTNIVYNSVTRTPTVAQSDAAGGNRDGIGICVFKESELPADAQSVTPTWSISPAAQVILCYTIKDADQSTTVRTTNSTFNIATSGSIALTGLTVGDLCIGGLALRQSVGGAVTTNNSWTEDFDQANGTGAATSAHFTATGSSETYSTSFANSDFAGAALAIIGAANDATVTPAPASLSLAGKTPTTSAFQNVRIREVLINESGQPVANAANIRLMVWYSGQCIGVPDVSLNGQTTDSNGTASWSIATGSLAFNQPIFYVAQDSISFSNYTCARMTPSYE